MFCFFHVEAAIVYSALTLIQ